MVERLKDILKLVYPEGTRSMIQRLIELLNKVYREITSKPVKEQLKLVSRSGKAETWLSYTKEYPNFGEVSVKVHRESGKVIVNIRYHVPSYDIEEWYMLSPIERFVDDVFVTWQAKLLKPKSFEVLEKTPMLSDTWTSKELVRTLFKLIDLVERLAARKYKIYAS